jgi:hypothetical protein
MKEDPQNPEHSQMYHDIHLSTGLMREFDAIPGPKVRTKKIKMLMDYYVAHEEASLIRELIKFHPFKTEAVLREWLNS